jgi:signal transduction histidine kinase
MMGWAQVLATAPPTEETIRKAVTSIVKNARAQTRVIEDLVDVSRIAHRQDAVELPTLDLRSVVASTIESMEPVGTAAGVRLEQVVPRDACFVAGDRDRLQQVLWNLVSQRREVHASRWGTVSVTLTRQDREVRVAVSDTG